MTRDNEIANAASEAMTETLMSCPMYEFSPKATDLLECAYIKGAEWADEHPASPWHSVADGNLPEEANGDAIDPPFFSHGQRRIHVHGVLRLWRGGRRDEFL